ncbi:unnamed protein product [Cyprideis torosa]|uniref:Uncharacterized protein n=1 Tax=Cyprideis torosa TaxID=163714 RepID=A0A7R8W6J1_9CRUS|nr:unnamed protein product [Cyprideis torosa]CAG0885290.1 unnamed protein product [Cyprideis torosa]
MTLELEEEEVTVWRLRRLDHLRNTLRVIPHVIRINSLPRFCKSSIYFRRYPSIKTVLLAWGACRSAVACQSFVIDVIVCNRRPPQCKRPFSRSLITLPSDHGLAWDTPDLSGVRITFSGFSCCSACIVPDPPRPPESPSLSRTRRTVSVSDRELCGPQHHNVPGRFNSTQILKRLREQFHTSVDAYIIPMADAHMSEYVSECDGRVEYVSGFTGSAATAVVTRDKAALWTDGRYFLQAEQELDCNWILMKSGLDDTPSVNDWLLEELKEGQAVWVDATLVAAATATNNIKLFAKHNIDYRAEGVNLVDIIWSTDNRTECSNSTIFPLDLRFAGRRWQDKLEDVRKKLDEVKVDALLINALDEVAWLYNLRGQDQQSSPVFRSYAVVDRDNAWLFTPLHKVTDRVKTHLNSETCSGGVDCVQVRDYDSFFVILEDLSKQWSKVLLPSPWSYSGGATYRMLSALGVPLEDPKIVSQPSPIVGLKASKNAVEVEGYIRCQIRDSATLVEFLEFLESQIEDGQYWTEVSAAEELKKRRNVQEYNMGLSFSAISAFGSNGAIIHYKPSPESDREINRTSTYLLDSGGQYLDGTTDVTRTMHYGTPTAKQIEAYTRVLMGSIDLARLVFPEGTSDSGLDIAARFPLYSAGLNYRHGTGHGIGVYLFVHEAPTQLRIYGKEPHGLYENYFMSDEPGYYEDGEFGIRLETIVQTVVKDTPYNFDNKKYLGFKAVTLVPFEPKLIDTSIMTDEQLNWLNDYHRDVRAVLGPVLQQRQNGRALKWLTSKTQPLQPSVRPGFRSSASEFIAPSLLCVGSLLLQTVVRS